MTDERSIAESVAENNFTKDVRRMCKVGLTDYQMAMLLCCSVHKVRDTRISIEATIASKPADTMEIIAEDKITMFLAKPWGKQK